MQIIEDDEEEKSVFRVNPTGSMRRSEYAETVKTLMTRTRGCELPGTYNPLVVGELFREQIKPWERLVHTFSSRILEAARFVVKSALDDATDEQTAANVLHEIVNPKLHDLSKALNEKIEEILEPHKSGHPITYNHYLTDNVQKAQAARRKRQLERVLRRTFS